MQRRMRWIKLGLIVDPHKKKTVGVSHVSVPCARHLRDDTFRIYYSERDGQSRSLPTWVDVDIIRPDRILDAADTAMFSLGEPGCFDDSGITPTWLLTHEGTDYLYFVGWNLGRSVPFRNALGLAIRPAGQSQFRKYSNGPILDRSIHDPCFVASASILVHSGYWHMWYLSCVRWETTPAGMRHYYHLKYATSADGIHWERTGKVAIDFASADEYAISRPSVLATANGFQMWYSYRGDRYRIGYAESRDGVEWTRLDHLVGIDVSAEGWDAQMVEYPCVFDHNGRRYMLYNGNRYGETGIGLAVLAA